MKWLIATLLTILCCLPVQACNGYAAGYGIGYSYVPQGTFSYAPQFYIQPPVQAAITTLGYVPPTTVQYSYAAPLSTVIQYAAPLYAPVQPYYTNFALGGYSRGGFFNNVNHHHHNHGRVFFNNGRGFSVNIRR